MKPSPEWSQRLLAADGVDHVDASLQAAKENKYYADTNGTVTTQQRVRVQVEVEAISVDSVTGAFESMRTIGPPFTTLVWPPGTCWSRQRPAG